MSDMPNMNLEDLIDKEEEAHRESQQAPETPQLGFQPPVSPPQQNYVIQEKRAKLRELREKMAGAEANGFASYKVDEDENGQMYFGVKSNGRWTQDKLAAEALKEEIDALSEEDTFNRQAAQSSRQEAAELARELFSARIQKVNKGLRDATRIRFEDNLRQVDWGVPQLRTRAAKQGLIKMLYGDAAQDVLDEHREARRGEPPRDEIAEENEGGDTPPKPEANEFGYQKGTVGWNVTDAWLKRQEARKRGTLGRDLRGNDDGNK